MSTLQKQADAFGKALNSRTKAAPMKAAPSTSDALSAIYEALTEPVEAPKEEAAQDQKQKTEEMVSVCPCGYRSCSRAGGSEGRLVPLSEALD